MCSVVSAEQRKSVDIQSVVTAHSWLPGMLMRLQWLVSGVAMILHQVDITGQNYFLTERSLKYF